MGGLLLELLQMSAWGRSLPSPCASSRLTWDPAWASVDAVKAPVGHLLGGDQLLGSSCRLVQTL